MAVKFVRGVTIFCFVLALRSVDRVFFNCNFHLDIIIIIYIVFFCLLQLLILCNSNHCTVVCKKKNEKRNCGLWSACLHIHTTQRLFYCNKTLWCTRYNFISQRVQPVYHLQQYEVLYILPKLGRKIIKEKIKTIS